MQFKIVKFSCLFICCFLALFGLHKGWNSHKQKQLKPKPASLAAISREEKPFVLIVPSYNNSSFIEHNLRSIFTQNYQNYRIIYIDDHSSDDTYAKAKKLIQELGQETRVLLIHNEQNQGALANIYNAIHSCKDHEIIVLIDGDDFLAHENVLKILNDAYQDADVWMTYGNFLDYPSYRQFPVSCKPLPETVIKKNSFRKHEWISSHLRTFYASLFKKIALEDLVYRGHFYPMGWDLAFMLPLLEMSGSHTKFISDILYLYNRQNPISDHRVNFPFQQECAMSVRSRKTYSNLEQLPCEQEATALADLLILSSGRPLQLYALLESIDHYVEGVNKISVLYPRSPQLTHCFEEIKKDFPHVHFLSIEGDFKAAFLKVVDKASFETGSYLLLAQEDLLIKDFVNLNESIAVLQKTKTPALYFSLGTHLNLTADRKIHQDLPPLLPLRALSAKEPLNGWQLSMGNGDWKEAGPLDMVLYPREQVKEVVAKLHFTDPASLEESWKKTRPLESLGVFYSYSKSLKSLPSQEITQAFESGLKIDIRPFFQVPNSSKKVESDILFIKR